MTPPLTLYTCSVHHDPSAKEKERLARRRELFDRYFRTRQWNIHIGTPIYTYIRQNSRCVSGELFAGGGRKGLSPLTHISPVLGEGGKKKMTSHASIEGLPSRA